MSVQPAEWIAYRRAVSEVFHALSQPITALQCSLELALRKARSIEDLQNGLRDGLENSQRLISTLGWLRKFAEAAEPRACSPVDLESLIAAWKGEMLPVAQAVGKRLHVTCDGAKQALADRDLMWEVLLLAGDYALATESEQLDIIASETCVRFVFAATGTRIENSEDISTLLSQAPELAVATRMVQSMDGSFSLRKIDDHVVIEIQLKPISDHPAKTLGN